MGQSQIIVWIGTDWIGLGLGAHIAWAGCQLELHRKVGQLVKSGCKLKGLNRNEPSSNHSTQAGGGLTHCTNSENMSHTGAFFCNNRATGMANLFVETWVARE